MLIAGVPAVEMRDALRRLRDSIWPFGALMHELKMEEPLAASVLHQLLAQGLVEVAFESARERCYALTMDGTALALASASRPIKRKTADRLLAELLRRAKEINGDPGYAHYVAKVFVFGSYLTDRPDLGDVDVAVEIAPKFADPEAQAAAAQRYAEEAEGTPGRRFTGYLESLFASEIDIGKRLKSSSQYLSIHPTSDPAFGTAAPRLLYEYTPS